MIEIIEYLKSALQKATEIKNPYEEGSFHYVLFESLKIAPSEPKTHVWIADEMRHRCHHCNCRQMLNHEVKGTIEFSIDNNEKVFEIHGRDLNFGNMYRLHPRIRRKNKFIKVGRKIFNVLFWLVGLIYVFGNAVLWILKKAGLDLN